MAGGKLSCSPALLLSTAAPQLCPQEHADRAAFQGFLLCGTEGDLHQPVPSSLTVGPSSLGFPSGVAVWEESFGDAVY